MSISSSNANINLLKKFPISWRFVIKKTMIWFLLAAGLISMYNFVVESQDSGNEFVSATADYKYFMMSVAALLILLAKTVYSILFKLTVKLQLSGDALVVRKGVFIRKEVGYPVATLANVGTTQSFLDTILGISSFRFASANDASNSFGVVEGFGNRTASELDNYVRTLITDKQPMKFTAEFMTQLQNVAAASTTERKVG